MPEGMSYEERTESATPRRREEARKKGQVAKSVELTSAFMFLMGLAAIRYIFPIIFSEIIDITKSNFTNISQMSSTSENIRYYFISTLVSVGKVFAPFAMLMLISALVINYAQVGFFASWEALQPKFNRIDPIKGFSRLISKRTAVHLAQSILKVVIVGYLLYATMKGDRDRILGLADMEIRPAISEVTQMTIKMGFRTALLLFALSVFDYAYQRWEHERSLKMTRLEVKEELKQSEGDPLIKSRIRSIQRETAMRRMMQAVPKADVIITNPTHMAVALKYRKDVDIAPRVCAKGRRLIAERIKSIAREYNIPIVEDKPLAHALYELELGQEIPATLYRAVAEILARVYQMNNRTSI